MTSETPNTLEPPRLAITKLIFSGGQVFEFEEGEAIAFVGPNNAGKSLALREIYDQIAGKPQKTNRVVKKIEVKRIGTRESFDQYLDVFARPPAGAPKGEIAGFGYRFLRSYSAQFSANHGSLSQVVDFFIHRSDTTKRQSFSDTAQAITLHLDPPTHPIHLLLEDDDLENRTSALFEHAYGQQLIPFRAGGNSFPLFVGERPNSTIFPDRIAKSYVIELKKRSEPLSAQGDGMRSFASIILACTVGSQHSILTLDEPEAFLHPPQARLLGRYLAEKRVKNSQLVLSTHSTDLLEGLCSTSGQKVRIIRLQRDGSKTNAYELDPTLVDNLASDPVAKFSGIMKGIFHEWVFITEAESDSLLYSSCVDAIVPPESKNPDVLWVHSGGKQRAKRLLEQIKSSKVKTGVIVDIDILNDRSVFSSLIQAKDGDFSEFEADFQIISNFVSSKNVPITLSQFLRQIDVALDGADRDSHFSNDMKKAITKILKQTSYWSILKTVGKHAFQGHIRRAYDRIESYAANLGIFIVPVGEMEGFCPENANLHGPDFAIQVLNEFDLLESVEMHELREFSRLLLSYMSTPRTEP
jgi:AAA domain, putative AbiEii toxin, Type IV TA system